MRQYRIRTSRIEGELCVGGAKNAALPIMAALCLNERETVIHNCPRIADTLTTVEILSGMGYRADFAGNTLTVNPPKINSEVIPLKYVEKMRSSILFMGAMLAGFGQITLGLPGGCNLGDRAIDLHLKGLKAMGAKIRLEGKMLRCETGGLKGAKIRLRFPSVGATENLMIAASRAKGETVIKNAAREPEIVDLARFLNAIGADIRGAGTSTLEINGVKKLSSSVLYSVMSDRIVAGTYLTAAAMTAGEITLTGINPADLTPITAPLIETGCRVLTSENTIALKAPPRLTALPKLVTGVHPGFPTDMQAQMVAALCVAKGRSVVRETVFNNRCSHGLELKQMGADIKVACNKKKFTIQGKEKLHGATVEAHDLRCGAALILAGLAAEGETIVQNAKHVERGYEHIEKDLSRLGAAIILETGCEETESKTVGAPPSHPRELFEKSSTKTNVGVCIGF